MRAVQATIGIAILLATLFTALPSRGLVSGDFYQRLSLILTPRPGENAPVVSQPQLRIGIVAGHSGNDSGAVCVDSNGKVTLTEAQITNLTTDLSGKVPTTRNVSTTAAGGRLAGKRRRQDRGDRWTDPSARRRVSAHASTGVDP